MLGELGGKSSLLRVTLLFSGVMDPKLTERFNGGVKWSGKGREVEERDEDLEYFKFDLIASNMIPVTRFITRFITRS